MTTKDNATAHIVMKRKLVRPSSAPWKTWLRIDTLVAVRARGSKDLHAGQAFAKNACMLFVLVNVPGKYVNIRMGPESYLETFPEKPSPVKRRKLTRWSS